MRTRTRDARALVCLVLAALVVAGSLVADLSHRAQRAAGTNGVWPTLTLGAAGAGSTGCQGGELVPAGTAAVQLVIGATAKPAPKLLVTLRRHGRLLARGTAPTQVGVLGAVAPIPRTTREYDGVDVCFTVGHGREVELIGGPTPPHTGQLRSGSSAAGGSMPITYLRAGSESWWSEASAVVRRMGMGRGSWGGTWIVWLAAVLVAAALALAAWAVASTVLVVRDDGVPRDVALRGFRRVPTVAWAIMAVAILNAAAWSFITPAFQVPDEDTHLAYAQQIAETGRPPIARANEQLSPELTTIMGDVRFGKRGAHTFHAALWSPLQQRRLERDLHAPLARRGNDDAGPADFEPPLYYALEAIPYRLASGATLLDRLALMRLLSATMAGITALFAFLFVREALPRRSWAWTVGGLGVAFTPLMGFVSGGVNPDALLFAVCAALFYCVARAFRRGLDTRLAIWIGVVLAIGAIGKINFYGLLPGAVVAIALAARASEGAWNGRVARLLGISLAIGAAPYALMTALDALVWERTFILARTPAEAPQHIVGLGRQFSYLWQVYLPRLPGQAIAFPEFFPGYELWFKGFVGRFGWVVVVFPTWAYQLAAAVFAVLGVLALRAVRVERRELRRRRAELLGYALTAGGLLLLIGLVALRGWAPGIAGAVQGRYVLPLLALFGAALALAARGAGERWGRAVGAVLVVAAVGWSLYGQLVTIAWFYG